MAKAKTAPKPKKAKGPDTSFAFGFNVKGSKKPRRPSSRSGGAATGVSSETF